MRPRSRAVTNRFVALAVAALMSGCSASPEAPGTPPTPASTTPTAAPTPRPTPPPTATAVVTRLSERLILADGRTITARCVGDGTPTILLEAGGGGSISEWPRAFVDTLGAVTTTCLYSRAGAQGSSPVAKPPVSMAAVTSDAYEVLELAGSKAGVKGPYIFVGVSLGGSVALADALARPDQAVGIAILDTDFPADSLIVCKAQGRTAADCQAEYEADIDARFMESQIAHAVHPLNIPAVLVSAMAYPECADVPNATLSAEISGVTVVAGDCAGLAGAIADKQIHDWKVALPRITQTRINASHDTLVAVAGPGISDLVIALVNQVRAGS